MLGYFLIKSKYIRILNKKVNMLCIPEAGGVVLFTL